MDFARFYPSIILPSVGRGALFGFLYPSVILLVPPHLQICDVDLYSCMLQYGCIIYVCVYVWVLCILIYTHMHAYAYTCARTRGYVDLI